MVVVVVVVVVAVIIISGGGGSGGRILGYMLKLCRNPFASSMQLTLLLRFFSLAASNAIRLSVSALVSHLLQEVRSIHFVPQI